MFSFFTFLKEELVQSMAKYSQAALPYSHLPSWSPEIPKGMTMGFGAKWQKLNNDHTGFYWWSYKRQINKNGNCIGAGKIEQCALCLSCCGWPEFGPQYHIIFHPERPGIISEHRVRRTFWAMLYVSPPKHRVKHTIQDIKSSYRQLINKVQWPTIKSVYL